VYEYDRTGEIAKSLEAVNQGVKEIERLNERMQFMWEMYKMQKELNETNRRLCDLEEKMDKRDEVEFDLAEMYICGDKNE